MKDRLIFNKTILANGLTIYSLPTDDPFCEITVHTPFGHAHNCNGIRQGTAHFLEHITLKRSKKYPEKYGFNRLMELRGSDFNAWTNGFEVGFELALPASLVKEGLEGLYSHIYEPIITSEDIALEATIIGNERRRFNRWWPGDDSVSNYLSTKWRNGPAMSLEQRLGSDEDLAAMTVDDLKNFHQYFFSDKTYVIIGGTFDLDHVCSVFSKVPTKKITLPIQYKVMDWNKREYHEIALPDSERFQYKIGVINNDTSFETNIGLSFLLRLLTNTVHGSLYEWLRKEKGWVYGLGRSYYIDEGKMHANLTFPLSEKNQVEIVRKELFSKIEQAINDQPLIKAEHDRVLATDVFEFQTLSSRLEAAQDHLFSFGEIYTEATQNAMLEKCKDKTYLRNIWDQFSNPETLGEVLIMPEEQI